MPWVSILAIFFVVWFLALFITLPFGVRSVERPERGHDLGAPQHPYMWRKVAASLVIAAVVTAALWYGLQSGYIDFRS